MSNQDPTSFLPTEDEARDPDEVLSALDDALIADPDALAIEAAGDADVVLAEDEPLPLGKSWAFDFDTGRFIGAAGAPLPTHGLATLRTWIEKCMRTPRGAFPAVHPPEYGVQDLLEVVGEPLLDGVGADLDEKITDALLFHPRITQVVDFTHDLDVDGEALLLSFTVITDSGDELPFNDITLGA